MKVLMRADTHVRFSIPESVPKAKCTLSQVSPAGLQTRHDFNDCSFVSQVIAALFVSLVSMIVGFVSAYTSPAAETMKKDLNLSDDTVRSFRIAPGNPG